MEDLIKAINNNFPPKEVGGFNSAVFFHHNKNGELTHCSPMFAPGMGENFDVQMIVNRLYLYSKACKEMADEMVKKTLPHS